MSRDGKGKFYRLLRLDQATKRLISAYREAKRKLLREGENKKK